jgi:hypothetical protein
MPDRPEFRPCEEAERLASALEVLTNLVFLSQADAEVPENVRFYMGLAEHQLNALQQITLRPPARARAEGGGRQLEPNQIARPQGIQQMQLVQSQTIQGESLDIDNKYFIDCTLEDCTLEYSGCPVTFERTHLLRCRYVFRGLARTTVQFLQCTGLMPHEPSEWGEFPQQVN